MPQRLWTRAETRRFLRAENPHQQQQQQLEQQRSNNKVQAAAQAGDRHSSSFSFSSVSRSISIASSTFAAVATVAANWSYPPRSPCNMPQHNATQRNATQSARSGKVQSQKRHGRSASPTAAAAAAHGRRARTSHKDTQSRYVAPAHTHTCTHAHEAGLITRLHVFGPRRVAFCCCRRCFARSRRRCLRLHEAGAGAGAGAASELPATAAAVTIQSIKLRPTGGYFMPAPTGRRGPAHSAITSA